MNIIVNMTVKVHSMIMNYWDKEEVELGPTNLYLWFRKTQGSKKHGGNANQI